MNKKIIIQILMLIILITPVLAHTNYTVESLDDAGCAVYFTGIGCPHCAKADPILLEDTVPNHNIVVIEYEIYVKKTNAPLLQTYHDTYGIVQGVPQLVSNVETIFAGDRQIIEECENNCADILDLADNNCALIEQGNTPLKQVDFNTLPGLPTIWFKDKVLIRNNVEKEFNNELLQTLLISDLNQENVEAILDGNNFDFVEAEDVPLSGSNVEFDNAIQVDGWVVQWKDSENINPTGEREDTDMNQLITQKVNIWKVISLAAVDAVNPCALAVLTMILLSIITYNPKKKKTILLSGLSFTVAVIIMYLLYGIIIIKFFQLIQAITAVRIILYKILAVVAIVLGILEIKDFFHYNAGSLGTEMPLSLRPKVKKLISKVTSPRGAFVIGLFVTLFLLPCTIGPYVIMGGILSAFDILKTLPLLLLYNIIFVLPMIAITFIVYFGVKRVEDVSSWKDKNIKILHLVAGVIIFLLGIGMLFGWV